MVPKLVSRNLFLELCWLFLLCLGALLSLILIGRVLHMRELFLSLSLGAADLGLLFLYLSPFFMLLLIPVACMLSVFLTFLRMSTDRELTALKAGGVSLYQLLPAPVLFCLLCTAANLFVSLYGLSWGMNNFRTTVLEYARTKTQLVIQPGVFNLQFPGLMIYAHDVDNNRGLLTDIIVQDRSRKEAHATVLAPEGRILPDPEHGRILFVLRDGTIYQQEQERVSVLSFKTYTVRLDLNRILGGSNLEDLKPKELSYARLRELAMDPAATTEAHGANWYRKVLVEVHKRTALPMACLVLGLFAVPLACAFEGLKRQYGVILAMLNFVVYYTLFSIGLSTGEAGTLSPEIGLWLPNGIFLLAGLYGLRTAVREKSPHVVQWAAHLRVLVRRRKAA
ncbi:MAG: LPS export ABC transporter permease LptF [Desulfovibrionaceae bacterium]|nr:LPS export ABC transporter permease LptF [Desulfovibrionaceae bacterium]